ncbi:hypothetical protein M0805_001254 [Coniferiporia weirii]|nr:hypothetical protein M0805_001254 [Coniferiporia weirii]
MVNKYIDAPSSTRYCGFDDFLRALGVDLELYQKEDQTVWKIVSDKTTLQLRNEYCKDIRRNTQRYGPFCELANHIISQLPSQGRPIVFYRNDPHCINGMFSNDRKPDVVVFEGKDLTIACGKWRDHSSKGPRGIKWTWSDVLHAFEFEASKSAITYKDVNVLLPTDAVFGGKADASPQIDIPSLTAPVDAPPPVKIDSATASVAARTIPSRPRMMSDSLASGSADRPSSCASSGKKRMMDEGDSEGPNSKKARRDGPRKDTMKQAARYAIDKLSYDANLRHTISGLIDDGVLRMCYYDRAVVCSRGFRFVNDLYRFVLLIKALVELSHEDRGIMERMRKIIPEDDADETCSSDEDVESDAASSDLTSLSDEDSQDSGLKIGEPCWELLIGTHKVWIYRPISRRRPYGLTGRAGRVDAAKCESLNPTKPNSLVMAIKASWSAARRTSEVQIITWAREVLGELDKKDAFRKDHGIEEGRKLSDCLPKVLASDDLENLEETGFRKRFGANFEDNRIFRAIVFEVLFPVYEVVDLGVYKRLFREIVQGHHFLFTAPLLETASPAIKHRDISVENVMYRILPDGTLRGVLNDWDLIKVGNSKEDNPRGTRTGTRPFMAIDLLEAEPPGHIERFDWESIFYVLLRIGCHYINGRKVKDIVLVNWLEHDMGKLNEFKTSNLTKFKFNLITDHFKPLVHLWLKPLQLLFRAGYTAQSDCIHQTSFDGETLGGHVTYKRVWDIFQRD